MAKRAKRTVLSEVKKREILAIAAVGCSRQTAADYVGCTLNDITRETEVDEAFGDTLLRNESGAEISFVRNIQDAAKKSQYWRAAAWLLERRYPVDFSVKKPGKITVGQVRNLLSELTKIIAEEVPVLYRATVIKRLDRLVGGFFGNSNSRDSNNCAENNNEDEDA